MSFLRHGEIFPSDGGASLATNAPAHHLDEFPAGYSSASWSPPEPASASPTGHQYAVMSSCRSSAFHRTVNCVLTVCVSRGGKRIIPPAYYRVASPADGQSLARSLNEWKGLLRRPFARETLDPGALVEAATTQSPAKARLWFPIARGELWNAPRPKGSPAPVQKNFNRNGEIGLSECLFI